MDIILQFYCSYGGYKIMRFLCVKTSDFNEYLKISAVSTELT